MQRKKTRLSKNILNIPFVRAPVSPTAPIRPFSQRSLEIGEEEVTLNEYSRLKQLSSNNNLMKKRR